MKKVETLGTLEMNHLMVEEVLFECPDLVKFTKVIDCSKENQYDALLLIKINGKKAKVLNFYSTDHMIYEDEYYKKLVEYLQQHTIGLHRVCADLADENGDIVCTDLVDENDNVQRLEIKKEQQNG